MGDIWIRNAVKHWNDPGPTIPDVSDSVTPYLTTFSLIRFSPSLTLPKETVSLAAVTPFHIPTGSPFGRTAVLPLEPGIAASDSEVIFHSSSYNPDYCLLVEIFQEGRRGRLTFGWTLVPYVKTQITRGFEMSLFSGSASVAALLPRALLNDIVNLRITNEKGPFAVTGAVNVRLTSRPLSGSGHDLVLCTIVPPNFLIAVHDEEERLGGIERPLVLPAMAEVEISGATMWKPSILSVIGRYDVSQLHVRVFAHSGLRTTSMSVMPVAGKEVCRLLMPLSADARLIVELIATVHVGSNSTDDVCAGWAILSLNDLANVQIQRPIAVKLSGGPGYSLGGIRLWRHPPSLKGLFVSYFMRGGAQFNSYLANVRSSETRDTASQVFVPDVPVRPTEVAVSSPPYKKPIGSPSIDLRSDSQVLEAVSESFSVSSRADSKLEKQSTTVKFKSEEIFKEPPRGASSEKSSPKSGPPLISGPSPAGLYVSSLSNIPAISILAGSLSDPTSSIRPVPGSAVLDSVSSLPPVDSAALAESKVLFPVSFTEADSLEQSPETKVTAAIIGEAMSEKFEIDVSSARDILPSLPAIETLRDRAAAVALALEAEVEYLTPLPGTPPDSIVYENGYKRDSEHLSPLRSLVTVREIAAVSPPSPPASPYDRNSELRLISGKSEFGGPLSPSPLQVFPSISLSALPIIQSASQPFSLRAVAFLSVESLPERVIIRTGEQSVACHVDPQSGRIEQEAPFSIQSDSISIEVFEENSLRLIGRALITSGLEGEVFLSNSGSRMIVSAAVISAPDPALRVASRGRRSISERLKQLSEESEPGVVRIQPVAGEVLIVPLMIELPSDSASPQDFDLSAGSSASGPVSVQPKLTLSPGEQVEIPVKIFFTSESPAGILDVSVMSRGREVKTLRMRHGKVSYPAIQASGELLVGEVGERVEFSFSVRAMPMRASLLGAEGEVTVSGDVGKASFRIPKGPESEVVVLGYKDLDMCRVDWGVRCPILSAVPIALFGPAGHSFNQELRIPAEIQADDIRWHIEGENMQICLNTDLRAAILSAWPLKAGRHRGIVRVTGNGSIRILFAWKVEIYADAPKVGEILKAGKQVSYRSPLPYATEFEFGVSDPDLCTLGTKKLRLEPLSVGLISTDFNEGQRAEVFLHIKSTDEKVSECYLLRSIP